MISEAVKPLEDAISRLETALDTPAVGGELPEWCHVALTACNDLVSKLERTIREDHSPLLEQIFAEDAGLAPHVEQLRQSDDERLKELVALQQELTELSDAAVVVEPDEVRIAERVEQAIQSGLQRINAIRRQEVALMTWHSESLNRDRGVVD